jgi:hypothetical protein
MRASIGPGFRRTPHGRVSEVLQLCDRGTTELLDVKDLMAIFGVSSASQRARTYLAAAGMDDDNPDMELGTPDLLVSRLRSQLINMRDSCRAALGE